MSEEKKTLVYVFKEYSGRDRTIFKHYRMRVDKKDLKSTTSDGLVELIFFSITSPNSFRILTDVPEEEEGINVSAPQTVYCEPLTSEEMRELQERIAQRIEPKRKSRKGGYFTHALKDLESKIY